MRIHVFAKLQVLDNLGVKIWTDKNKSSLNFDSKLLIISERNEFEISYTKTWSWYRVIELGEAAKVGLLPQGLYRKWTNVIICEHPAYIHIFFEKKIVTEIVFSKFII